MTNTYKFNLLKYVYGRLYAGTFECNCIKEERRKIYSWLKPLNWLKRENYISFYKVEVIDNKYSKITYWFNHNKLMYEYYLKAIARTCEQSIIPTSENIVQRNMSDFEIEYESQFVKPTEKVSSEDHVRCKLTNEEIMATI